jgi:ABC-type nitrate/sulfonate/bicarbonate transport system substrate-binding protein
MWGWPQIQNRRWITALCIFATSVTFAQDRRLEPVSLQLKWTHQFQFAGYYLAVERGYYREAGLDVTILEGGPTIDVADAVVSGRADFGVGTSELMLDFAAGKPVVVLGVVYQHSPLVLATRSDHGVRTLEDLRGRAIMMEESASDLLAMLRLEGLSVGDFSIVPHTPETSAWHNATVAAVSTYTSDEPFLLDQTGIEYRLYYPEAYGIDFYGDNFFTRSDIALERPQLARAFREATNRGWEDARSDPYAAIDLILRDYPNRKSRAHLVFEANKTIELMTNLVHPGHMEQARWESIGATFVRSGMLSAIPSLDAFLFDYDPPVIPPWVWKSAGGALAIMALLTVLATRLHSMNRRLSAEIAEREVIEANLRQSRDHLQQALSEVKTLKSILPICSFCKKIREDDGDWVVLERYISTHSGADFSHGICPECLHEHYPEHGTAETT